MAPLTSQLLHTILEARTVYYNSDDYNSARTAISIGAIVGIVISVVVTIAVCIAICVCVSRSNKREKQNTALQYQNARPAVPSSAFTNNTNVYQPPGQGGVAAPQQAHVDNSYGAGLGWSGNHGGAVATPPPVQTYGHNTQHTGVFGGGK